MPTVQRAQREVSTAPLPGVRKTAAKTAASEGAGLAVAQGNLAESIGGVGSTVARMGVQGFNRIQDEERERADSVAILSAERQISEWENKRLYDPQTGALNVRGKDSFTMPEQINQEYDDLTGKIESGLGTDRQRAAFARLKMQRGAGLDLTVRRHVFNEMNRYEGEELKALVENAQSSAIANALDPRRVGEELDRAIGAIKTHAPRLGMGPEAVDLQVKAVTSTAHVGVIERLLADDRDGAAKAYFEETRGQISGPAIARVEKAIDEGTLRGTSQRKADEIIAAGGTLTEQREKVKGIDDPKLRDAVNERVEHNALVKERADRELEENNMTAAYNILDKTPNIRNIPPATWATFNGATRAAMRTYSEHLIKGTPVATDLPTYYGLMQKAASNPEEFATTNLLGYRGKLDETEFKQLAGLQLSIRTGNAKAADKDLGGFRTNTQILDDTLRQYGIEPSGTDQTSDERLAIAQLRRMLDTRIEAQSTLTGKKPTNVDIQQAADDLLSQKVNIKVPGSWLNILPGGAPFFDTTTTKRLIDMKPGDVPADYRAKIIESLQKSGRPVSDTTILDLYLEARARGLVK